ncbi:MAG TPA: hypothetical protein VII76_10460 [Acidimicrobiales bacterium]
MRTPRVSTVAGGTFVIWGTVVGLERLHDNSFLTHVATGRLILAHGVPTRDPYTFTALGRPWVVESWLASVLYRGLENLAGGHGLQVLHAVLCALLAALGWMLTRPARQLGGRILASGALLAVGTGYWSSRPLLIALVLFAVLVAMVETDTGPPWAAVPLMWVWLNVHGSWPLGLAYLLLRVIGRRVDGAPQGRLPRLFWFAVLGAALGALNPIGLRLVAYPLSVITHHAAFAHIVEWQSPSFSDPVNLAFLVEVLVAMVLLVARRGSVEDVLVVAVFSAAAFSASRNVPVAALLVTPVLARGLAGLGTIDGKGRGLVPAAGLVALVALGVALTVGAVQRPAYNLSLYPVHEVTWLAQHDLVPGRVATTDYVGNYLEFRYGTRADAFIDDRADVFPPAVEKDYGILLSGSQGWQSVLRRYRFDVVLWPRTEALASLIAQDPGWRVRMTDRHWVVAVRTGTSG